MWMTPVRNGRTFNAPLAQQAQNMRQLTEEETKIFFEKLSKYIGRNIQYLVDQEG